MHDGEDWYDVLEVHRAADSRAVDVAYRRLARRFHPDVNASAAATETMQRLNDAYAVLSDPARRAAYDRRRCERTAADPERQARRPRQGREEWERAVDARAWTSERFGAVLLLVVLIAMSGSGRSLRDAAESVWAWAVDRVPAQAPHGTAAATGPHDEESPASPWAKRRSDIALAGSYRPSGSVPLAIYRRLARDVRAWGRGVLDLDLGAAPGRTVDLACETCPAIEDGILSAYLAALHDVADRIDPDVLSIDRFESPAFDILAVTCLGAGGPGAWGLQVFARRRPAGVWRAVYGRTLGRGQDGSSATVLGFAAGAGAVLRLSVYPCAGRAGECEALVDLDARTVRLLETPGYPCNRSCSTPWLSTGGSPAAAPSSAGTDAPAAALAGLSEVDGWR